MADIIHFDFVNKKLIGRTPENDVFKSTKPITEPPTQHEQGWWSHQQMLARAINDLENESLDCEGMAIIAYNPKYTRMYIRGLTLDEVQTITEAYVKASKDGGCEDGEDSEPDDCA